MGALEMASKYTERILKVITIGANHSPSYFTPKKVKLFDYIMQNNEKSKQLYDAAFGDGHYQKRSDIMMGLLFDFSQKEAFEDDVNLKNIKAPTLLLHGSKDTLIHPQQALLINNNISNSTLYFFAQGNHNLQVSHFLEINE